jgi:hypothetical protein
MFSEVITVYSASDKKPMHGLQGQNIEFVYIKAGDNCSYHCACGTNIETRKTDRHKGRSDDFVKHAKLSLSPPPFNRAMYSLMPCASWYVPNTVIRRDLQIPTVKEEIRSYSSQYSARFSTHPNDLIVNLIELPDNRRLRRHLPNDLPTGFLV